MVVINPQISEIVKSFKVSKELNSFAPEIHLRAQTDVFCIFDREFFAWVTDAIKTCGFTLRLDTNTNVSFWLIDPKLWVKNQNTATAGRLSK